MAKDLKDSLSLTELSETHSASSIETDSPLLGPMFSGDSVSPIVTKAVCLESLIHQGVRDCNFSDFIFGVLQALIRAIPSEAGSILEVDYTNGTVFFRASLGQSSDRLKEIVIPANQGIVGHVIDSKRPLVVNNLPENQTHLKNVQAAVGFEARNLVAIPILVRGRVYGVLELLNRVESEEDEYSSEDVEVLTSLVGFAAKIIEMRLMINWRRKKAE